MSLPEIVFISGWGTGNEVWNPVVAHLEPELRYRCVAWQRWLEGKARATTLSENEPVVLAGWSLGGLIALQAAAEHSLQQVAGLVLVAGTARMTAEDRYPGTAPRTLRAMIARLARGSGGVVKAFAELCVAPDNDAVFCAEFVRQAEEIGNERLLAGLRYLEETDVRSALPSLDIPALILHGECDQVIPVACARYLAERMPRARLVILPGASHVLCHTASQRVAEEIGSFAHGHFTS